jgi:predicted ester cyclase
MGTIAVDDKQMIQEYFQALSGQPKTEQLLDRFISDPSLKEHIRQSEAAFPAYEVIAHQMVAEGDLVAARCTLSGVHKGEFAGIAPTGKTISTEFMIFYRVIDGLIAEHWIQVDMKDVANQLMK